MHATFYICIYFKRQLIIVWSPFFAKNEAESIIIINSNYGLRGHIQNQFLKSLYEDDLSPISGRTYNTYIGSSTVENLANLEDSCRTSW